MKHLKLYESWEVLNKRQKKLEKQERELREETENEIRKKLNVLLGDKQEMTIKFPEEGELLYGKEMSEDDEVFFNEFDNDSNEHWCKVQSLTYNNAGNTRVYHYSKQYGKTDWPIGSFEESKSLITILGYLESLGTYDDYWAKEEGEAMGFFNTTEGK